MLGRTRPLKAMGSLRRQIAIMAIVGSPQVGKIMLARQYAAKRGSGVQPARKNVFLHGR